MPSQTYKNAISVELYIKLAASLHNRIRGDRTYLDHAIEAWEWFRDSGMINADQLVNDGLNTQSGGCDNNGGTTWTYN
ncbi:MAG TPA: glycoside hydrolase family 76 protein [Nocardioidaceae bacterium]|nr:glycoside hydrolase family 76 protein [Nocardioidaceae bacterium]